MDVVVHVVRVHSDITTLSYQQIVPLCRPETGHVVDEGGLSLVVGVQKVKVLIFGLQELQQEVLERLEKSLKRTFGMLRKTETRNDGRMYVMTLTLEL